MMSSPLAVVDILESMIIATRKLNTNVVLDLVPNEDAMVANQIGAECVSIIDPLTPKYCSTAPR